MEILKNTSLTPKQTTKLLSLPKNISQKIVWNMKCVEYKQNKLNNDDLLLASINYLKASINN